MKHREKLTQDDLYNGWLTKYHNTTVEELIKNEPELIKTSDWYKKYAVTQAQHDEWYEWAINKLSKFYGTSKKQAKRNFCFDYLNIAPSIIQDNEKT
jgi:hypothetical protein